MKTTAVMIFLSICVAAVTRAQNSDVQNMFRLAQSFEQAGDADHAGQLYEQLQAAHPDNFVYFDALRRNYTARKKYDAAIDLCYRRLQTEPLDVAVMTSLGGLYNMAGHPAQADSVWDRVLASAPGNPGVYRLVAAEQTQLRLLEKAVGTYKRGRTAMRDSYGFANELAALYTAMMNYRGAADEYLLMLEQNEFQLDYVESRMAGFTGRPDGLTAALAAAQIYAGDQKRSIVFLRVLAWLWMEAKQYDQAFDCVEKIENRINSNGMELFMFGERAFRENAFAAAAKAYTRSLEVGLGMPFAAQAKFGNARCLEELSVRSDSTAAGEEQDSGSARPDRVVVAGEDRRNSVSAQPDRGLAAGERQHDGGAVRIERVLAAYEELAREYPLSEIHAQSLYRIGSIRAERLHDLTGALRAFDSITVIAPASPMLSIVRTAMGDVYEKQGKPGEAWTQYATVGSSPQSTQQQQTDARYRMAELMYFQTQFDSALTLLEPLTANYRSDQANDALALRAFILENKESDMDALNACARADYLARREKLSEAIAAYASIIVSFGTAPLADDAMMRKADLEVRLRRPVDALRTLQALLAELPKSTERDRAQFRIGEIYEHQLRDKENAMKAYGEMLSTYPNSLFTEEARKRIRLLRGDAL
jgi:tetratricopeptide (TPR) repeat protein